MRLDFSYVLGALWGTLSGPPVCSSNPSSLHHVAGGAARSPAEVTAFVDVNVVPMDIERVIPNQTVLVKNGRITALGPVGTVQVAAGAVRIDGRGKYLLPGLSDMHVHDFNLSNDSDKAAGFLFTQLAGGVTAIRYGNRRWPSTIEKPRPYFYIAGSVPRFVKPGLSPDSVITAYKAAGYNFIALRNRSDSLLGPVENSNALLAAGQRQGVPPASHFHEASIDALGTYGGSIEHLYSFLPARLTRAIREGTADKSPAEIRAMAEAARRAGVWITPTMACYEYFQGEDLGPRVLELRRQLIKALQDAGVGLLLGAEGAYIADELAALVRAGLTPYQALAAGTRNVAQYFSLLGDRGTVAVGKRADLVLLAGNPLIDIEQAREPVGVMLDGRWLDRAELDRLLLAYPPAWFRKTWVSGYDDDAEQMVKRFEELTDSLAAVPTAESDRVLRLLVDELGALRRRRGERSVGRTPALQKNFDPIARAWMREQARRGREVTVPGVPQ